jgi:hypothetical protein
LTQIASTNRANTPITIPPTIRPTELVCALDVLGAAVVVDVVVVNVTDMEVFVLDVVVVLDVVLVVRLVVVVLKRLDVVLVVVALETLDVVLVVVVVALETLDVVLDVMVAVTDVTVVESAQCGDSVYTVDTACSYDAG